jgi:SPP1 gp7 family putative phage head morphogenesis protein
MAQTANEALLDALLRHQTYLLRYSGYVRNRIWAMLGKSEADLAALIRSKLANSKGLSTPVDVRRMESLLAGIAGIRNRVWEESDLWLREQMLELSYNEPIVLKAMIATVAPVVVETVMPPARQLKAIALSKPFEGRILKDWADTLRVEDLRRIHAAIQLGMVAGEPGEKIVDRVIGTRALDNRDGVLEMTRRQVQAITRTAVQHVANSARADFMDENSDIITAELYVATLDARTTPICRALDGKTFPLGTGPRPPLHFNCRSLRVAALDGDMLGQRPAKASTTKQLLREFTDDQGIPKVTSRDDLPRGYKTDYDAFARKRVRELTGRVPSATNYQTWLTSQSKQFQEDTLGVTRAKLFRDGGLTLDRFVAANGTELTLGQLALKSADAFRAAGLDPQDFL